MRPAGGVAKAAPQSAPARQSWVGRPIERREDEALLSGRARFIDDLEPVAGLRYAAVLRSPHAHARILSIDTSEAAAMPGVVGIVTGAEVASLIKPVASVIRSPIAFYPCAVDKVRYVGEPVAVVIARDRYLAEDAIERIRVEYDPLPVTVDPAQAVVETAPVLHEQLGSNIALVRNHVYGDPEHAFAVADHVFALDYRFPRYIATPMETFGVIAHYEQSPEQYTVWSNFQGPFVIQPLMAASLGVAGNRLRLITPPASGGSFGVKQAVFPYIVLLAAASRITGVPVKWIEDRAEHLTAATGVSDRAGRIRAAFTAQGKLTGLHFENVANMGAYVRPPEPASLYRMHSASNGAYLVENIRVDNRIVVTNTPPVGLNRGYGGPQFYFALERIMDVAARGLGIDPGELRRRNFVPKDAFPYHAVGGSVFDAGNYEAALEELLRISGYDELLQRREQARREGRLYGIGFATGVEPSGSNMAYVTLAQTPEQRAKAAPKSGAPASATVTMDPTGRATLRLDSTPNGQGHATVAAQIVADRLGIHPDAVDVVTEIDTLTSAWSISSGNYSNRFSSIVSDAIADCADAVAWKLRRIAGEMLDASPDDIELADGAARVVGVPDLKIPVHQIAANTHWNTQGMPEGVSPGLSETAYISPHAMGSVDEADRVASAVTYGFVADVVAVEIDRETGELAIDRYASVHDVGTQLNPLIVEGQIRGGFLHGLGAALMEELRYDEEGQFLSGTFADYTCPTAMEVPEVLIGHTETRSPANRLGAKGMGDGSSMLTPAALANAVADALGRDDIEIPLTMSRLWRLANPDAQNEEAAAADGGARPGELTGAGTAIVPMPPDEVWRRLTDAETLAAIVPGCRKLVKEGENRFRAEVELKVAAMRGLFSATIDLRDPAPPRSVNLVGTVAGELGFGRGEGVVTLEPLDRGTRLSYRYRARIGGKVATVGQRMLGKVTEVLIARFFKALAAGAQRERQGFGARLGAWFTSRKGRRV
ncbi:xanthine dehydrogenase family protein molybdopterin-binding subunit [Rhodoligotrophos defluvii]|uniref:xanthine dehydrogenase family protein molybdopterin-binding subunit n=1 Tax=Rhodoligotrophos defluvii TaxID=2561934 RepID=UPI0010C95348|nr:molybdopterin cofactor-binding domain-containing protein [Rhodoligotrophos defluvii]